MSVVFAVTSKSAEVNTEKKKAQWVEKTPGKSRSVISSAPKAHSASKKPVSVIRPDSWRLGMEVVNRELKQRRSSSAARTNKGQGEKT